MRDDQKLTRVELKTVCASISRTIARLFARTPLDFVISSRSKASRGLPHDSIQPFFFLNSG